MDKEKKDQTSLFYAGKREITARSATLVRRGLRQLLRKEARLVCFPKSCSLGKLFVVESEGSDYWWQNEWQELGEATSEVLVPPGKKLILEVREREEAHEVWAGNCYAYEVESFAYLLPLAELNPGDLQGLDLTRISVSDLSSSESWASIEYLYELTGLEWLNLSGTASDTLFLLNKLKSLHGLDCSGMSIYSLEPLKSQTELKYLSLNGAIIDCADIYDLSRLTSLRQLDLNFVTLTKRQLDLNFVSPTNLVGICDDEDELDVELFLNLTRLEVLRLKCLQVKDILLLKNLPKLRILEIVEWQYDEREITELRETLPNCEIRF